MQARVVQASRGARWLAEGWRLFRAAPLGWLTLVFAYWLLMTLASLVPVAGVALASLLVPAFSVGFMAAARAASRGRALELALLFEGFRHERRSQLALGVAYLAARPVLGATAAIDGGVLARWMLWGERPGEEALRRRNSSRRSPAPPRSMRRCDAVLVRAAARSWLHRRRGAFFSFFGC